MKSPSNKAFTLVELIVVIVILAILATIAFLSFSSQSSSARDSTRLADLTSIGKGLSIVSATTGKYPLPDGNVGIFNSGSKIGYQGEAGDSIKRTIKLSADGGKDPVNGKNYTYTTNALQSKFQLLTFLENKNGVAINLNPLETGEVSATEYTGYPYVKGDKLATVIVKVSEGVYQPLQDTTSTGADIASPASNQLALESNSIEAKLPSVSLVSSFVGGFNCPAGYEGNGKAITEPGDANHPSFSPDGKYITYASGGFLYKKNSDDILNGTMIMEEPVNRPSYSPNGASIIYTNGNGIMQKSSSDNTIGDMILNVNANHVSYSYDGNWIVYYSGSSLYKKDIRISDDGEIIGNTSASYPVFSPDGTSVIYRNNIQGRVLYLKSSSDQQDGVPITTSQVSDFTYSPDGKWIVYTNSDNGNKLYRKSSTDASDGIQISSLDTEYPEYSKDGNWIVYDSNHTIYKKCAE